MTIHGVDTALTLFAAGTLTRTQAARKAGVDLDRFDDLCAKRGIPVTPAPLDAGGRSHVNAD
ncbi:hypothetical protein [Halobaculum litoreum]|uniref:Uncharacterized protein n=1 Tax=Halobaculum litoreum TaxID=3031998 RepID=A0ABD5XPW1_9EURY|nr:hypothetical protein [Halobaculum sp. DT92]